MKECNYKHKEMRKDNKTLMGIFFMIVGMVLLGSNFHFIPYFISRNLFTWPMLLIGLGIVMIATKGKSVGGLFLIGIGGVFMWDKLFHFSHFQWQIAWPLMFIFVGAGLVIIYLGKSIKEISESKPKEPKPKPQKSKRKYVEFDIDKIEPIED
jgi:hypothetical protein